MEASDPRFDRAADVVEVAMKDEVAEGPGNQSLVWRRLQPVFLYHPAPKRCFIFHIGSERKWHRVRHRKFEPPGDFGPHVLPPEVIAIGDIEDLVPSCFRGPGP